MEVSIDEIVQMQKRRDEINKYNFNDIVFTWKGIPVYIEDSIKNAWRSVGFNNTTFIESKFYLTGWEEEL